MQKIDDTGEIAFTEEYVRRIHNHFGRKKPKGLEYFADGEGNLIVRASGKSDLTIPKGA